MSYFNERGSKIPTYVLDLDEVCELLNEDVKRTHANIDEAPRDSIVSAFKRIYEGLVTMGIYITNESEIDEILPMSYKEAVTYANDVCSKSTYNKRLVLRGIITHKKYIEEKNIEEKNIEEPVEKPVNPDMVAFVTGVDDNGELTHTDWMPAREGML